MMGSVTSMGANVRAMKRSWDQGHTAHLTQFKKRPKAIMSDAREADASLQWNVVNTYGDVFAGPFDRESEAEAWADDRDDLETFVEESGPPPNPGGVPQRDSPTECGCGVCSKPKMDGMVLCIQCETEGCDPYKERGVSCE